MKRASLLKKSKLILLNCWTIKSKKPREMEMMRLLKREQK
jgi:hypothetical protein